MFRTHQIALLALLLGCLSSCAKRGYITGGDQDTLPPVMLSSNPPNYSVNFDKQTIKIQFDEYIKLKSIGQNLIISPPMENTPDVLPLGGASKVITVKITDTLKENTTYSFNFGESISDNNEGNVLKQFKYIFSTGSYVDSLMVSGKIKSANQRKSDNFVNVMLYDAATFTDSTVYKHKPLYITNTLDSLTTFTIENIKAGSYYLLALKDKNNNFKFDPRQDKIAFIKDPIQIPTTETYELNLFQSDEKFQPARPTQISENKWYLPYQGDASDTQITISNNHQILPSTYTLLPQKDSLQVWLPKIEADSLSFLVSNKSIEKEFTVRPRKLKAVDTLAVSAVQGSVLDFRDSYTLQTTTPLSLVNAAKIAITDKDSIAVPFTIREDRLRQELYLDFEKKEMEKYRIDLLPGALTDFFEKSNDSLHFATTTKQLTDYGNLFLSLSGVQRFPVIIEVLDLNEKLVSSYYTEEETQIKFIALPPKKYIIRAIYDDNKNGKWDSGYYIERRLPEEIIYFPEEIDVRANWDIEQVFQL